MAKQLIPAETTQLENFPTLCSKTTPDLLSIFFGFKVNIAQNSVFILSLSSNWLFGHPVGMTYTPVPGLHLLPDHKKLQNTISPIEGDLFIFFLLFYFIFLNAD